MNPKFTAAVVAALAFLLIGVTAAPASASKVSAVVADGTGGWFVAGDFSSIGGVSRTNLAHIKANGTVDPAWNPAPSPDFGVYALAVAGGLVYVAGDFDSIGGQNRHNLAALDATTGNATSWNPSPGGGVFALAVSGTSVYAGGDFATIGGQNRTNLAALDATTGNANDWNPSPNDSVADIATSGSRVYVGGNFSSIGGQNRHNLAALDATTGNATAWNPTPRGVVSAIALSSSDVFAGGEFDEIGEPNWTDRSNLAAVDPSTGGLRAWNPSPSGPVYALAVSGSTVYIGGDFTEVYGGKGRNYLASVDASTGNLRAWNPSPNGRVTALAVSGSKVAVGGAFSEIGGQITGPFAQIDGDGGALEPDTTPPVISITSPTEGQHFAIGQTVASVFTCTDLWGSGMASCLGSSTLSTATPGSKKFTVTATDKAGNTTKRSVNYVVDPPTAKPPSNKLTQTSAAAKKTTIKVSLTAPASGKISTIATTTVKGKKITYSSKRSMVKAGKTSISLKPTSKAKAALKKVKSIKVLIKITFTPTGGKSATTTKTVKVKGSKR